MLYIFLSRERESNNCDLNNAPHVLYKLGSAITGLLEKPENDK